jgi:hypothetical protein
MFFDNLLEILKFYSDVSKDDMGDLTKCEQMLRQSLSRYRNLHIINCGSFYEQLYFLLTLKNDQTEDSATLNVDSDHLIVDTDYIKVIKKSGCHIVPTGYEETHWRLSFSLAELILAHTLNNKQRRLYSITKFLIKSKVLNPIN